MLRELRPEMEVETTASETAIPRGMASGCPSRYVQLSMIERGYLNQIRRGRGRFVLICLELYEPWMIGATLIDMADQRPPQTAKESKRFLNRLKKVFGRGSQSTPPTVAAPPAVAVPPADLAPTVSTITTNPEEAAKLRAKYTHFRILVIGRANAGKTTLLKRVCNTMEDPLYSKVRYQLRLIPHAYRPFTDRLTRPRRCHLCAFL